MDGGGEILLTSLIVYEKLDERMMLSHLEELNKKHVSGFIVRRRNVRGTRIPYEEAKKVDDEVGLHRTIPFNIIVLIGGIAAVIIIYFSIRYLCMLIIREAYY